MLNNETDYPWQTKVTLAQGIAFVSYMYLFYCIYIYIAPYTLLYNTSQSWKRKSKKCTDKK